MITLYDMKKDKIINIIELSKQENYTRGYSNGIINTSYDFVLVLDVKYSNYVNEWFLEIHDFTSGICAYKKDYSRNLLINRRMFSEYDIKLHNCYIKSINTSNKLEIVLQCDYYDKCYESEFKSIYRDYKLSELGI